MFKRFRRFLASRTAICWQTFNTQRGRLSDFKPVAQCTFTPRDSGVLARVKEGLTYGVQHGSEIVFDRSQEIVPVRTGELKASGHVFAPEDTGSKIVGGVGYAADYAAFVEYGTGIRGAASPGAGANISYSPTWPGQIAQPFLRPSADSSQDDIEKQMKADLSAALR